MDFSPYKPSPDEHRTQQKSKGKARTTAPAPASSSYQSGGPPPSLVEEGLFSGAGPSLARGAPGGTVRVNKYETRMPIRVDLEAALAYVLGPITGTLISYTTATDTCPVC